MANFRKFWSCFVFFFNYETLEPNTSSPLNTQAAALWSNQEGMLFINNILLFLFFPFFFSLYAIFKRKYTYLLQNTGRWWRSYISPPLNIWWNSRSLLVVLIFACLFLLSRGEIAFKKQKPLCSSFLFLNTEGVHGIWPKLRIVWVTIYRLLVVLCFSPGIYDEFTNHCFFFLTLWILNNILFDLAVTSSLFPFVIIYSSSRRINKLIIYSSSPWINKLSSFKENHLHLFPTPWLYLMQDDNNMIVFSLVYIYIHDL